ncbi:MAG: fatty acid desaturase CarF family protein [Betaproteobacteria bacterium]
MRTVEVASIVLFLALLLVSFQRFAAPAWFVPLALLLGWLLADLFSGLVHWALDSFGSVTTPVFGPAFIRPFREHHAEPEAMTRHDFIEVNGASCIGCLPLLLSIHIFETHPLLHAVIVSTCLGVLFTNQCHKWAHSEQPHLAVRFLQKAGLILSSKEHIKHHTPPYDTHFCTASGWLNRPFNFVLKAFR